MFWIDYLALNPNKKVTFIDEKLSCYIKHDYGITSKNYRSEVFQLINIAKKKYPKYYKDIKKRKKYLFYELAINKFNIKNYEKSIKYLFISIKFGIYSYKILFWIILCLLKIIKKKNSSILVTGSAGFIGMHLCLKLKSEGFSVVGIDNLNDYYDVELKKKRHSILKKKILIHIN